jgi:hypothetical protein
VVFPDLVRGYNQAMRKGVAAYAPVLPENQQLTLGIHKHHATDKVFHNMPEFTALQQALKAELNHAELLGMLPRYWFWVHIAVEMMIDRNLLKLYPLLYVEFYEDLATVSQPVVEKYFSETGCKSLATDFFGNFKVFMERRFLQYYPSDEKFTEALFGAWYRATGNQVEIAVRTKAQQALLAFEQRNAGLLVAMPEIVARQLKNAT